MNYFVWTLSGGNANLTLAIFNAGSHFLIAAAYPFISSLSPEEDEQQDDDPDKDRDKDPLLSVTVSLNSTGEC